MTSVLGTLTSGTKVLQGLPGKSGKAFDAIDDNADALAEADELSGALCGLYDGEDADIEAQLNADLGLDESCEGVRPSVVEQSTSHAFSGAKDLGLPEVCTEPLVSRAELLALSKVEPKLSGL